MRSWAIIGGVAALACTGEEPPVQEPGPVCGDARVEGDEACDDGNAAAGDGCDAGCAEELLRGEVEPNDAWASATPWNGEGVLGALPAGDQDCWNLELQACDAVQAVVTAPDGTCPEDLTLSLHDPTGALVAVGSPDLDRCARLDPIRAPGARMTVPGTWALCVTPLRPTEVHGYLLAAEVLDSLTLDAPMLDNDDLDADGWEDRCDPDRDGDEVDDVDDVCPGVPDGPATDAWTVSSEGFLRSWLAAGPFTGTESANACLPSADDLVGGEAVLAPGIGDPVGGLSWHVQQTGGDRLDLRRELGSVEAPREAYLLAWVRSPTARTATLAVGADDGVRAWLGEEVVLEVASCQGVNRDQFQAQVSLTGGWDRLLLKVRDQGGGWGAMARFLDADDEPIVDLELSLAGEGPWPPVQVDGDGDGLGDLCDPEP
jgi:cysteine-rich repeat protein